MKHLTTRQITTAALVGALYVVLSYFGNIFGLTYGPIQCRFAEALTVLPFLFPAATPGLFVGCLIANLLSPYGLLDVVAGSAATLIACLWTQSLRNRWLAPLPPVVCNAVIVGAVIAFAEGGTGGAFWTAYAFNAFTVGLGELIASAVLGQLLLGVLPRVSFFREMIPADKLDRLGLKARVSGQG